MQWIVPASITKQLDVLVEAETEDEALQKFKDLEWVEDVAAGEGELVDWEARSDPQPDPE